jgi:hypothetical protein
LRVSNPLERDENKSLYNITIKSFKEKDGKLYVELDPASNVETYYNKITMSEFAGAWNNILSSQIKK